MTDKLRRLLESIGTFYDYQESSMTSTNQIDLISVPAECMSSYGEKDSTADAPFGFPTLCDEFTVQVGYDDFPTTTTISIDTTKTNSMWMEFLSSKTLSPTTGSGPAWGVSAQPDDITLPLGNGYGGIQIYRAGSRTVRFHARVNPLSISTPPGSKPTVLSMTVFGRIRNEGATRLLLAEIYDKICGVDRIIEQFEARQGELERNLARFARHQDPSSPLLIPSTMRR